MSDILCVDCGYRIINTMASSADDKGKPTKNGKKDNKGQTIVKEADGMTVVAVE